MESYVLFLTIFRNAFHSWHPQQTRTLVKSRTRKDLTQRVDSSWEAADRVILEGRFLPRGFCKDGEVFKRSCALGLLGQHILRLLCLGPVPSWHIPLSGRWERSQFLFRLKSPPWVNFSTFKVHFYFNQLKVVFLRAIRHLCSSSQEDSYFGKKKRWKLFICRALWPSPTFEL